jgi:hypothetical protein
MSPTQSVSFNDGGDSLLLHRCHRPTCYGISAQAG